MTPTERRRAVQPLWNALERGVGPYLSGGVLLCVSGGGDSRALLEAFARWRRRFEGPIAVASVDHGVRAEAAAEVEAVLARARVLGLDGVGLRLSVSKEDEASLRGARYDALFRAAAELGLGALVTAHHADDDAEGVLLDLLGLGGGRGGAGMPQVLETSRGLVLRPFLCLSRPRLDLARTALFALDVVQDPLDVAGAGRRADLRHHALPELRRLRPRLDERLAEKARRTAEAEEALFALAASCLERDGDGWALREATLRARVLGDPAAPGQRPLLAVARRAVEAAIRYTCPGGDPRRSSRTVDALLDAAGLKGEPRREGRRFHLSGVVAEVVPGGIRLSPSPHTPLPSRREPTR